jgi:hypothetical protein
MADPPIEPSTEAKMGNTVLPDTLFKLITRREVEEKNLRVSDTEFQHVTRLPIQRRFYRWLLFAPSDGKRWTEFILKLKKEEGNEELLGIAEQLRPKEFQMLNINAKEIWDEVRREGGLTPEVEAQLARERAEGIEILLNNLDNRDYIQMTLPFDSMTDEQVSRLVNGLSGIRVAGLISYLTPTQIERLLPHIKSEKQRQLIQDLMSEQ